MTEYKIPEEFKSNPNVPLSEHKIQNGFKLPEYSEWTCHLFGDNGSHGVVYRPSKGKEPNWFWRMTQHLILGHKWVKEQDL